MGAAIFEGGTVRSITLALVSEVGAVEQGWRRRRWREGAVHVEGGEGGRSGGGG